MQPYLFPYIGYFQLIEATNKIVFYDDVTYIKGGWINKNKILGGGQESKFTLPLSKASSSKEIKEIQLHPQLYPLWRKKFLKTVEQNYGKSLSFKQVYPVIDSILNSGHNTISNLAIESITSIYSYLSKEIDWEKSSICASETKGLDRADRIIQITKDFRYDTYINLIGGQKLYDKKYFQSKGIGLNFIKPKDIVYQQSNNKFVPWLSIIDILMFNEKGKVAELFKEYEIL